MKSKSVILCIFIVCLEVRVFGFPAADVQLPLQEDNGQPKAVPKDPDAIVYPDQITRDSYGNPVTPFNDLGADHGIGHMTDINKNDKLDDRGNFEADKRDPSGFVIPSYASGIMKVETLLPPTAPKFPAVAPTKTDSSSSFNQIDVSDKILPPYREDEQKVKYPVIEVNTQATIFFPDSNFLNQIASHNNPNDLHKKPINSNAAVPQNTGSIPANIPVHNKPNNIVPVNTPLVPPTSHTPVKAPANNNGGDIYTGGFGGPPGILSTGNVNYQQPIKPPTAPQPTLGAPVQPQVVNKPANGGDIYSGGFGGSSGILSSGNVNYQQPIKPPTQPQPTLGAPVQVPASNKPINGGDIYSGGFGGPSGVLNTGNANAQQPIKPPQTPVLQAPPPQIPANNNKVNSGDIYTGGFGGAQGFGGSSSNAQKPFNPPQAAPTFGTPVKVPTPIANNREIYTGGFGGAPGILGNSQNVGYGVKNPHAGNPIGHAPAVAPILPSSSLELPKIPSPPQPIAPVNSVPSVIQHQQSPPATAPQPPTLLAPTSFQQGSFILDLNLLPPSLPPSSIASGSGSLSPLPKPAVVPPVSQSQLVPAVPQTSHHHHHHQQQQHHQHDRPIPSSSDIYQGGFGGAPGVLKPYDNAGHHH